MQQNTHQDATLPTGLLHLPNELLIQIAEFLPRLRDVNSFRQVNRWIADLVTPVLFARAADSDYIYISCLHVSVVHWAASCGDTNTLKKLFSYSRGKIRDLNALDITGTSPLYAAVRGNHSAAVEILLRNGAIIDNNTHGLPPLHLAILNDDLVSTRLLVEGGANLDEKYAKLSPLHIAVLNNDPVSTCLLVEAGANIEEGHSILTPIALAYLMRNPEVIWAFHQG